MSKFQSQYQFPNPNLADPDGEGVIAIGADLQPNTLLHAYSCGLFPWFNEGEPIAWWSPNPRCVVYPPDFVPKKSLKKTIKKNNYTLGINLAFKEVMHQCATVRQEGTWISQDMIDAYTKLQSLGYAFSIEVWSPSEDPTQKQLVGGLYGLKIGNIFFGESMFHHQTDCSKIAFFFLTKLCQASGVELIDCQVESDHLISLGALTIDRQTFLNHANELCQQTSPLWKNLACEKIAIPAKHLLDEENFNQLVQKHLINNTCN